MPITIKKKLEERKLKVGNAMGFDTDTVEALNMLNDAINILWKLRSNYSCKEEVDDFFQQLAYRMYRLEDDDVMHDLVASQVGEIFNRFNVCNGYTMYEVGSRATGDIYIAPGVLAAMYIEVDTSSDDMRMVWKCRKINIDKYIDNPMYLYQESIIRPRRRNDDAVYLIYLDKYNHLYVATAAFEMDGFIDLITELRKIFLQEQKEERAKIGDTTEECTPEEDEDEEGDGDV